MAGINAAIRMAGIHAAIRMVGCCCCLRGDIVRKEPAIVGVSLVENRGTTRHNYTFSTALCHRRHNTLRHVVITVAAQKKQHQGFVDDCAGRPGIQRPITASKQKYSRACRLQQRHGLNRLEQKHGVEQKRWGSRFTEG